MFWCKGALTWHTAVYLSAQYFRASPPAVELVSFNQPRWFHCDVKPQQPRPLTPRQACYQVSNIALLTEGHEHVSQTVEHTYTFLKSPPLHVCFWHPHDFSASTGNSTNKTNGRIWFYKKDSFVNVRQKGTIYFTKGHSFISPWAANRRLGACGDWETLL